jgi:hypothetical protein
LTRFWLARKKLTGVWIQVFCRTGLANAVLKQTVVADWIVDGFFPLRQLQGHQPGKFL